MNYWHKPPEFLTLNEQEIHLWRTNLALSFKEIQFLKQYLSSDEIIRSDRFKFDLHRHRYIVSRAVLRIILGKYLKLEPSKLKFQYNSKGKPQINPDQNQIQLQFNHSHSEDISLYGITTKYPIGIDIEYRRSIADLEQIAYRFFTPRECQLLAKFPPSEKINIFFQLWTGKEAYLKCTGEGIAGGLDKFEIRFNHNQSIGLSGINDNLSQIYQWFFRSFLTQENYQSTVIVNSEKQFRLNYFEY